MSDEWHKVNVFESTVAQFKLFNNRLCIVSTCIGHLSIALEQNVERCLVFQVEDQPNVAGFQSN